jgi:hypothetical protein
MRIICDTIAVVTFEEWPTGASAAKNESVAVPLAFTATQVLLSE